MPGHRLLPSHSPSSLCDHLHHHHPGSSQQRHSLSGVVYSQRAHEHASQPLGCRTSGSSRPQQGLPNGCQSPLYQGMDIFDASLTILVQWGYCLHLRGSCQTGKQAYAVHLLSNQCHAQPLWHFHSAAWGHGQHSVAELLSVMHLARTAHSWLWVPSTCDQREILWNWLRNQYLVKPQWSGDTSNCMVVPWTDCLSHAPMKISGPATRAHSTATGASL